MPVERVRRRVRGRAGAGRSAGDGRGDGHVDHRAWRATSPASSPARSCSSTAARAARSEAGPVSRGSDRRLRGCRPDPRCRSAAGSPGLARNAAVRHQAPGGRAQVQAGASASPRAAVSRGTTGSVVSSVVMRTVGTRPGWQGQRGACHPGRLRCLLRRCRQRRSPSSGSARHERPWADDPGAACWRRPGR